MIAAALRRQVRERAGYRCEYCLLAEEQSILAFHIEHIIPRQHGGATEWQNLALACPSCNLRKGPNLTGIDPDTGKVCRLYHPRRDRWADHFRQDKARIVGRTSVGRVTIWVLAVNAEEQLLLRSF